MGIGSPELIELDCALNELGRIDPTKVPTTGQDAELAAIQRILLGEQYMTVYKAIKLEAETAAAMAVAKASGKPLPADLKVVKVNNGTGDIHSVLLTPVSVMVNNIKDTIVKDQFWTLQQIANTPQLQAAAKAAGLQ